MSNNNGRSAASPFTKDGMLTQEKGLTKRETFAMAAMQGLLSNGSVMNQIAQNEATTVTQQSVIMADELLKELSK